MGGKSIASWAEPPTAAWSGCASWGPRPRRRRRRRCHVSNAPPAGSILSRLRLPPASSLLSGPSLNHRLTPPSPLSSPLRRSGNSAVASQPAAAGVSDAALLAASVRLARRRPRRAFLRFGHDHRRPRRRGTDPHLRPHLPRFAGQGPDRGRSVRPGRAAAGSRPAGLILLRSRTRNVGLVAIRPPGPVVTARLAPPGYRLERGMPVASVGCNNGDPPTVQHSQVTSLDKFVRAAQHPGGRPAGRRPQRRRAVLQRRIRDRRLQRRRSERQGRAVCRSGLDLCRTGSGPTGVRLQVAEQGPRRRRGRNRPRRLPRRFRRRSCRRR